MTTIADVTGESRSVENSQRAKFLPALVQTCRARPPLQGKVPSQTSARSRSPRSSKLSLRFGLLQQWDSREREEEFPEVSSTAGSLRQYPSGPAFGHVFVRNRSLASAMFLGPSGASHQSVRGSCGAMRPRAGAIALTETPQPPLYGTPRTQANFRRAPS